jgi:hypothetical protein
VLNFFSKIYIFLNNNFKKRFLFFFTGVFLIYFDSYVFFNIPLPWIGLVLCIFSCLTNRLMAHKNLFWSMILLIFIMIASTYYNYKQNSVPINFIILRLINILAFLIIVNYLTINHQQQFNITYEATIINIALFFSIISILAFIIHMNNITELNIIDLYKNRLTTGAGKIYPSKHDFNFTSETFYRLSGTFREPSFLGAALILPFFLALKNCKYLAGIIIFIAIYFTYSLAIFIAIIFGTLFSALVIYRANILSSFSIKLFAFFILGIFLLYEFELFSNVYLDRLFFLKEDKSRYYVYENLRLILGNYWIGNGIGFALFKLAESMTGQISIPVSILNLYINIWSSGGVIALIIIIIWLILPSTLALVNKRKDLDKKSLFLLLIPLNTFLILYLSSFEELHIWHAISLGLYLSYLNSKKIKKKNKGF